MSKQLFVDPNVVRAPGKITFTDIPVNTYQKKVKDELGNFTPEQFKNIYRDMLVLREFETMIQLIKTTSEYCGVPYTWSSRSFCWSVRAVFASPRSSTLTVPSTSTIRFSGLMSQWMIPCCFQA